MSDASAFRGQDRNASDCQKTSLATKKRPRDEACSLAWSNLFGKTTKAKVRSAFSPCPICFVQIPTHRIEKHAWTCTGIQEAAVSRTDAHATTFDNPPGFEQDDHVEAANSQRVCLSPPSSKASEGDEPQPCSQQLIPGLFLYENFVTPEEEEQIVAELDADTNLPWKNSTFNGQHRGKRWGVHCNLRDRQVSAPENPMPTFYRNLVAPKLLRLPPIRAGNCFPNEANAIDYHRRAGHFLKSHVDDRQLSKEPIANLSLAGNCYMTFTQVKKRPAAPATVKVYLPRRCLQILTGMARYDYSHGIAHCDLLSDRRISVTMRESPLSSLSRSALPMSSVSDNQQTQAKPLSTCKASLAAFLQCPSTRSLISPSDNPLPGLFIFKDFITKEEETIILSELDRPVQHAKTGSNQESPSGTEWRTERHSGLHREQRFGVDHDLWSPAVRPPKREMPEFFTAILLPRLRRISAMTGIVPNDMNAIEYQRSAKHCLVDHFDDRKKHAEPIASLSLVGACYMTYCHAKNSTEHKVTKIYLGPRCLQVLTGRVRYDYTHGIKNDDLLDERRVSLTMRRTA
jgi:alkylated DNA repair dioxygenase AlkB